jgi:hypothetical protein
MTFLLASNKRTHTPRDFHSGIPVTCECTPRPGTRVTDWGLEESRRQEAEDRREYRDSGLEVRRVDLRGVFIAFKPA